MTIAGCDRVALGVQVVSSSEAHHQWLVWKTCSEENVESDIHRPRKGGVRQRISPSKASIRSFGRVSSYSAMDLNSAGASNVNCDDDYATVELTSELNGPASPDSNAGSDSDEDEGKGGDLSVTVIRANTSERMEVGFHAHTKLRAFQEHCELNDIRAGERDKCASNIEQYLFCMMT